MQKRLAFLKKEGDKLLVTNISDVIETDTVVCPTAGDGINSVYVDVDYKPPNNRKGKTRKLHYNQISEKIEAEYVDE